MSNTCDSDTAANSDTQLRRGHVRGGGRGLAGGGSGRQEDGHREDTAGPPGQGRGARGGGGVLYYLVCNNIHYAS